MTWKVPPVSARAVETHNSKGHNRVRSHWTDRDGRCPARRISRFSGTVNNGYRIVDPGVDHQHGRRPTVGGERHRATPVPRCQRVAGRWDGLAPVQPVARWDLVQLFVLCL